MTQGSQIIVEDMNCTRPDGSIMSLRIARPAGTGPFPAVVDIHGGGWVMGDRKQNAIIDDALAAQGIVVAAPDFRMPPKVRYPEQIADIHLAIRWLKANAAALGSRPDLVGGVGTSSGAHQLLLCVLKPDDTRYGALAFGGGVTDARLKYVVACWPVADPLARFRMAQDKQVKNLLDAHAAFWADEAAMAEGNPQLILERGEAAKPLPPLLAIQGTNDDNLTPDMADNFVAAYSKAGGNATLKKYDGMPHTFVTRMPDSSAAKDALEEIARFIHANAKT